MKFKLLIAAAIVTAMSGVAYAAAVSTVDQKALAFSVGALSVKKGTLVRFTNSDTTPHNILIVGAGSTINGGLQQPGGEFKAPFTKPGSYQVTCGIHPKMKMTVEVE
jgi:cytochrome c peroxidase